MSLGFSEIEKPNHRDIQEINPKVSVLYENMKKSAYHISNSFEQQLSLFKKVFEKNLSEITLNSEKLAKVDLCEPRISISD